jgi:hypothetical protein
VSVSDDLRFQALTQFALRRLDLIGRPEIITWATREAQSAWSYPSLLALAGLSTRDPDEVDHLLALLLEEQGQSAPTEFQCGMLAAGNIARQIGSGALEPIDGARAIWSVARRAPASEPSLRDFVGLASEWDDDPDHRAIYEEEIRSAALALASWRP